MASTQCIIDCQVMLKKLIYNTYTIIHAVDTEPL